MEATTEDLASVERAGGRERWWKAAHQATYVPAPAPGDVVGETASADFSRAVIAVTAANARAWSTVPHTWPKAWRDIADFSDVPLRLTVEEARQLSAELTAVLARYRRHDPTSGQAKATCRSIR